MILPTFQPFWSFCWVFFRYCCCYFLGFYGVWNFIFAIFDNIRTKHRCYANAIIDVQHVNMKKTVYNTIAVSTTPNSPIENSSVTRIHYPYYHLLLILSLFCHRILCYFPISYPRSLTLRGILLSLPLLLSPFLPFPFFP